MMAQCKEKLNIAMFGQKRIPSEVHYDYIQSNTSVTHCLHLLLS